MATATVVKAWKDSERAYLAVRVTESGGESVEYLGALELSALAGLSLTQQKAALVAAVKQARDGQRGAAVQELAISGTVTV